MKILFIIPYFYPKPGGQANYAYQIGLGLKRLGHEVVVATLNHDGPEKIIETVNGIKVYRFPINLKLSNTPVNVFWKRIFKKLLREEKPDLINAHLPWSFMADFSERVRGSIPYVVTYHNDLVKDGLVGGFLAKLTYRLGTNKTLRNSDAVIATSKYYAATSPYLKRLTQPIDIVAPGVDLDLFNDRVSKTWLKEKYGDRFTVLFVSQLDKTHAHKGLDLLISAVALLNRNGYGLQLVVVGKGNAVNDYKEMAKQQGLDTIFFSGYVKDEDLPAYYAGSDVLVLPSKNNAEGFGMVLIEANACGTPVIGSDAGGISQAVEDGTTGFLVKPRDVSALADAISQLYNDPDLAHRMGAAGAVRSREKFGWEGFVDKTEKIFQRVIKEKKA